MKVFYNGECKKTLSFFVLVGTNDDYAKPMFLKDLLSRCYKGG